jgi:hypothetical protein
MTSLKWRKILPEQVVRAHLLSRYALFNLKPDERNQLSSHKFLSEPDITIEASLKPDLLPHLAEHAVKIEEAAT